VANTKNKTYNIYNKETGEILSAKVDAKSVKIVEGALVDIGYDVVVKEEAAGGSTGAGSIAVNMGGKNGTTPKSLKAFMQAFNAKVTNKFTPYTIKIDENFDMESVFSRLSSMEKAGSTKKTEGTTFGIEDDNGNIMKVTVRSDQASDFEQEIATHLADIKTNVIGAPAPRGADEVSIAELLFKLKDRFDIIDVEFPKIPTDVIYNADKASYNAATDTGALDDMGDDLGGMDGAPPADDPNAPLDLTDYKEPQEAGDDEMGLDMEMDGMDDSESVEEFPNDPEGSDEGSILNKVIDMLKAQAEAETEKAKADAEKARADQARYTAQASRAAVADQEEALRYEVEMEEAKRKEKDAARMADMAKHRISKVMGVREADEMATSSTVQRERQSIQREYQILPQDDDETKAYKMKQRAEAMREWASRLRQAQNRERFKAGRDLRAQQQQKQQQQNPQQQQQNPQQQNQNPNQNPNQQQNGAV